MYVSTCAPNMGSYTHGYWPGNINMIKTKPPDPALWQWLTDWNHICNMVTNKPNIYIADCQRCRQECRWTNPPIKTQTTCSNVKEFLYYQVSTLMTFQKQKGKKIDAMTGTYSEVFVRDLLACMLHYSQRIKESWVKPENNSMKPKRWIELISEIKWFTLVWYQNWKGKCPFSRSDRRNWYLEEIQADSTFSAYFLKIIIKVI